jgi:hypothetical protein
MPVTVIEILVFAAVLRNDTRLHTARIFAHRSDDGRLRTTWRAPPAAA